jgi:hypothetical protein
MHVKTLSLTMLVCMLMVGCAGGDTEPAAAPETVVVTETAPAPEEVETPDSEPAPTEEQERYPFKGYPKVVRKSEVPSQMHLYVDGPKAVAVAPGVFTQWIQGVSLRSSAETGALFGYCAAVDVAKKKLHNSSGHTCW